VSDLTDHFPLFIRSEDDIRVDFDARANAGMTSDDPDWVDTRVGGPFYLDTQPMVVEFASAYSRMNEVAASGILILSWGEHLDRHAEGLGAERLAPTKATGEITFLGTNGTLIGTGARMSPEKTDPDVDPPVFETTDSGTIGQDTTGELTLPIQAVDAGEEGNVAADTITFPQTGIAGVASLTNADPTTGGSDEETDAALKKRLLLNFEGKGSGTMADYAKEVLEWPQVGRVTVEPAFDGPGTVRIVISDEAGDPLAAQVTPLQLHLDPEPGLGKGWAPINHVVTVATVTPVVINNLATVEFKDGYSLDGTDGSIATRTPLENAISSYENGLLPGEDVIYNHVIAQFFRVEGVLDVNATLRTGTDDPPTGTTDISITALQVARCGNITLSE
jgi:uncharacterized phage protein gp47/JayE